MARAAGDLPVSGVDFIDDGMTDNASEKALDACLAELDEIPAVDVGVRAADTLAEARANGEV
jgi:hypothetical protein